MKKNIKIYIILHPSRHPERMTFKTGSAKDLARFFVRPAAVLRMTLLFAAIFFLSFAIPSGMALENTFSGNYIVPEQQSGFKAEAYEANSAKKFERGALNLTLSWLEIPHSIKAEGHRRRQEDLPVGIETFFIGFMKGTIRTVVRMGVGVYEMITFRYPQGPILEDMDEWMY